jgi:hypothetical protein
LLAVTNTRDNIVTLKKNTQTSIDASKYVDLEVNTEKTKYMLLSHHQIAGQNHDINIGNMFIFRNDDNKSKPDSGGN